MTATISVVNRTDVNSLSSDNSTSDNLRCRNMAKDNEDIIKSVEEENVTLSIWDSKG